MELSLVLKKTLGIRFGCFGVKREGDAVEFPDKESRVKDGVFDIVLIYS